MAKSRKKTMLKYDSFEVELRIPVAIEMRQHDRYAKAVDTMIEGIRSYFSSGSTKKLEAARELMSNDMTVTIDI